VGGEMAEAGVNSTPESIMPASVTGTGSAGQALNSTSTSEAADNRAIKWVSSGGGATRPQWYCGDYAMWIAQAAANARPLCDARQPFSLSLRSVRSGGMVGVRGLSRR
jgi:hypothetical protein